MADLYLSGTVGYDITEEQVLNFLKENDDQDLNVFINSPGGSVFEGLGIYNILRDSGRNITTINNGLAASMGSILFLAGDNRIANTGSIYMVHKPSSIVWGDADDMKKEAEVLDKIQDSLASVYKERAGIENIEEYINDETWWNVNEMIEKGVAHSERKIEKEEGDVEDVAKIDDLKAEKEKLEAEKAQLAEQLEEAKLEAEVATAKAELANTKAEIEKTKAEAKAVVEAEPEEDEEKEEETEKSETKAVEDDKEIDIEVEKESKTEVVEEKAEAVAKVEKIDTTKTVAKKDNNTIPAWMQTESKY
nr:MAG TPA: Putative ATP dependent Clp protease [Caudoviricetes sp.]